MKLLIDQYPRKCDKFGCGHYGASRGKRKHTGVDIIAGKEETVFSPITGKVTKIGYCYADDLSFRYVEITNSKYTMRVLYINPLVSVGDWVKDGEYIGEVQTLNNRYKGITDHIHVEIKSNGVFIDPTDLLEWD